MIGYIKEVVTDFGRHMDSVIPRGVDSEVFLELKYGNKARLEKFHEEHNLIDSDLVEKVAVREFLKLPEDEIVRRCLQYMERERI